MTVVLSVELTLLRLILVRVRQAKNIFPQCDETRKDKSHVSATANKSCLQFGSALLKIL